MTTGPLRKILVGWDSSPGAAGALHAAAALIGQPAGHVVALAVVQPLMYMESAEERAVELARRRRQAEETFAAARNELPGTAQTEVTLRVIEAKDAARTVCDYAREHDFDLVVLGRHGVGGTFRPRLGHIAHAAARNSEVPLLLTTQPR